MPNNKKKSPDSKKAITQKEPILEPRLIEAEHKEFREKITKITAYLEHFSGPLPPPEAYAKYEETLKGSADRILIMAEKQLEHRQGIEKEIVKSNILNEKLGLAFGLIVGLAAISGGVYCAYIEQILASIVIGGGGVASLVTAFVQGSKIRRREKEENEK